MTVSRHFASAALAFVSLTCLASSSACILDLDHLSGGCVGPACDAGGTDSSSTSDGNAGGVDGGDDGGSEAASTSCVSLHGPKPIRVTARGGGFCIDSTEVTAGQYAEFIATNPSASNQPTECAWNASFASLIAPDSLPAANAIAGVDWCDALAFCTWSGKTLCGGFSGLNVPVAAADDPMQSTWFAACSADGQHPYPYGDTIQNDACNDFDKASAPIAVGTSPKCEGGYPGIFDLVGNVEEWTATCEATPDPANDGCLARGGHYTSDVTTDIACATNASHLEVRSLREAWRGFRCCSH